MLIEILYNSLISGIRSTFFKLVTEIKQTRNDLYTPKRYYIPDNNSSEYFRIMWKMNCIAYKFYAKATDNETQMNQNFG